MKHLLKLCSVALVVFMICTTALAASAADNYIVLYGFAFDINSDNKAVIHSYDDRSANVVIPQKLMGADVELIDDYAFFGDEAITSVSFSNADKLKKIGVSAFYGCTGLCSVEIPSWIETLCFGAFQNCSALAELVINEGISTIPAQCFYGCSALQSAAIPESVTEIGERAFMDCSGLSRVEIPDTVVQIADNAFDGCDELVVYCTKDSYALTYAINNEIAYVITDADTVEDTYMLGDADSDGKVVITDATIIQRVLAGICVTTLNEKAADVNQSGAVDITDATCIRRYLAGISTPYKVGEVVL